MLEGTAAQASAQQIAQVIKDFMALKAKFKAFLPEKLSQLQRRLDDLPRDEPAQCEPCRPDNGELFYRVSVVLYQKSSLTMSELSSALSVPLSTATRMVDWFVESGYAARLPDTQDRRVVRVALTDSGRETYELSTAYVVQRVDQLLSGLTPEERQILFSLLGKAARALKKLEV